MTDGREGIPESTWPGFAELCERAGESGAGLEAEATGDDVDPVIRWTLGS